MTIIASFVINNYPVLIGDIVTSGDEVVGKSCHIPTIGSIQKVFPEGSGYVINGVVQKLYCITSNLAIGFAGNIIAANLVLRELRNLCESNQDISLKDIASYFTLGMDSWCKERLQATGFIKESKGIAPFSYNAQGFQSKHLGEVRLCGTGTYGLKTIIESFDPSLSFPKVNPLELAVGYILGLINVLIGNEFITSNNLLEYYGGGYEIVTLVNGTFRKIQDISYVIWLVHVANNGDIKITVPQFVLKIYYVGDLLFIRKISLESKDEIIGIKEESINVISSIGTTIIDKSKFVNHEPPSFNSPFTCHYFFIESGNGLSNVYSRIEYTGNNNYKFKIFESKAKFDCYIYRQFIVDVASEISAKLKQTTN